MEELISEVQLNEPEKIILNVKTTKDQHLLIVLAKYRNEFVTWSYNRSTKSLGLGHYFSIDQLEEALTDYKSRN